MTAGTNYDNNTEFYNSRVFHAVSILSTNHGTANAFLPAGFDVTDPTLAILILSNLASFVSGYEICFQVAEGFVHRQIKV
jgi:hypothetical protein